MQSRSAIKVRDATEQTFIIPLVIAQGSVTINDAKTAQLVAICSIANVGLSWAAMRGLVV